MKPFTLLILNLVCLFSFAQSPKRILKKLGENPVFFIDSVNVDKSDLTKYDPKDIASVTIYKEKEALDLFGEDGKDGVIFIETIPFAKKRYWNFFKSKSSAYAELVPTIDADTTIQYILNKNVLTDNFEGNLASVDDKTFKEIRILNKKELEKEFGATGKLHGVVILSGVPENLHNGKKKF